MLSSPLIASIFSVKQEPKLSFDYEDKGSGLEFKETAEIHLKKGTTRLKKVE